MLIHILSKTNFFAKKKKIKTLISELVEKVVFNDLLKFVFKSKF